MFGEYVAAADRIPEGIRRLKGEKEIYLYGNGIYAKEMLDILDSFRIKVEGVLVSREFVSKAEDFYGNRVYIGEEFLENNRKEIAVVAGFHVLGHRELTNRLTADKYVKTVYVLNGCQIFWSNGFRFVDSKVYLVDNYYAGLLKRNLNIHYFKENYTLFLQTYDWLEDEKSKRTMDAYLKGHIELTAFPMLDVWEREDVENQYFPEDIIHLEENEVFVDCGAYIGDTLENFLKKAGHFRKYYALEPDRRHFETLHKKVSGNIVHIPVGAWDKKDCLCFSTKNGCGEVMEGEDNGTGAIKVDKLDDLIDGPDVATFLKMDIEGAELQALHGAVEMIKRGRPKLAICMYHKREDLITIPQFIKSIVPEYKLYLRAHFAYASELVLYAIDGQGE